MRIRILFAAILALALPVAVSASDVIAAGTSMHATLNVALDSKTAYVGQPFSVTVQPPYPDADPTFQNARIYGHVTAVTSGGQGRNPSMKLALDSIRFPNYGDRVALYAKITSVQQQRKSNALREAGGTVAGMVVGNIIGKWLGVNGGGAVGAVGGFLLATNNKTNFNVPAGSDVGIQLTNNLAVR